MATRKRPGDAPGILVHPAAGDAAKLLESGEILGGGRIAWGSNHAFLVHVRAGPDEYIRAVYKPRDGERPLYDFPRGTLYRRERAAFIVSRALGWPRIPVTVIRDGPLGPGSMQLFVESDPNVTYFELAGERREELHELAVFDLLVNNADRKAGHCLLPEETTNLASRLNAMLADPFLPRLDPYRNVPWPLV